LVLQSLSRSTGTGMRDYDRRRQYKAREEDRVTHPRVSIWSMRPHSGHDNVALLRYWHVLKCLQESAREELGMPILFPQALLSCVGEGREPSRDELAALTEKIWREAYGAGGPSGCCERAALFARAAMIGMPR